MGIGGWVLDRLIGGNHNGPKMGGFGRPPAGVPVGATGGGYPQSPLARQQQTPGFRPSSAGSSFGSQYNTGAGGDAGDDKPWWQNGDILKAGLNTIGGITGAVLEERNQNRNREAQQRQQDFEERQYREEQERKQQMAAYMQPILDRLMGQAKPQPFQAPRYGGG